METKVQINNEKKQCAYCEKTLPLFGSERKNGKEHYGSWKGRIVHKKCKDNYMLLLRWERKELQKLEDEMNGRN